MNKPSPLVPDSSFKARFTTAEFLAMVDSGAFDAMKVELVDGELERMPPPKSRHGSRQARVMIRLAALVDENLVSGETGLDLGDDTVLGCDVALLHAPVSADRWLLPDEVLLVVEVAESTASRDLRMKRLKYAGAGVAHYWVIDGERSTVHSFTNPQGGDYGTEAQIPFGQPVPVPGTDRSITID